jgi:hypothetical protein
MQDLDDTDFKLLNLAAAINPEACWSDPEEAIRRTLRLVQVYRDLRHGDLSQELPFAAQLAAKFQASLLVILTKEPDDLARRWLRENAKNKEDKFENPHRLLKALKQCAIKPEPAEQEDGAVEWFTLAIGADAFQARFRSASPEEEIAATSASLKEVQDKIHKQVETQLEDLKARRGRINDDDYKATLKMLQRRLDTQLASGQLAWEARQTRKSERESWAEYWDEHKSNPSIYLIAVEQLEAFLECRCERRAQQRKKERKKNSV